ncbi:MAG: DUF2958 domain-containing protein, partial [Desulfobacterales bacterium]|nr:DUF2958 domain-containing protein [Desulfobacterales bacterium]
KLYETEGVPFEEKIIYQHWRIHYVNFYWLIAELDRDRDLAYGYANLNDDLFAEWGYISLRELYQNGARRDESWKPI